MNPSWAWISAVAYQLVLDMHLRNVMLSAIELRGWPELELVPAQQSCGGAIGNGDVMVSVYGNPAFAALPILDLPAPCELNLVQVSSQVNPCC